MDGGDLTGVDLLPSDDCGAAPAARRPVTAAVAGTSGPTRGHVAAPLRSAESPRFDRATGGAPEHGHVLSPDDCVAPSAGGRMVAAGAEAPEPRREYAATSQPPAEPHVFDSATEGDPRCRHAVRGRVAADGAEASRPTRRHASAPQPTAVPAMLEGSAGGAPQRGLAPSPCAQYTPVAPANPSAGRPRCLAAAGVTKPMLRHAVKPPRHPAAATPRLNGAARGGHWRNPAPAPAPPSSKAGADPRRPSPHDHPWSERGRPLGTPGSADDTLRYGWLPSGTPGGVVGAKGDCRVMIGGGCRPEQQLDAGAAAALCAHLPGQNTPSGHFPGRDAAAIPGRPMLVPTAREFLVQYESGLSPLDNRLAFHYGFSG